MENVHYLPSPSKPSSPPKPGPRAYILNERHMRQSSLFDARYFVNRAAGFALHYKEQFVTCPDCSVWWVQSGVSAEHVPWMLCGVVAGASVGGGAQGCLESGHRQDWLPCSD